MRNLDMVKGIVDSKAAMLESRSLPNSRSSSPSHGFIRSNADSMKPKVLTYSGVTLISLQDHMRLIKDWISNMFPNGYSINQYRSNLNSTLDQEIRVRCAYFESCTSVEAIQNSLDLMMESKFPIHVRRLEAINPKLRSNEDATTFLSRNEQDF